MRATLPCFLFLLLVPIFFLFPFSTRSDPWPSPSLGECQFVQFTRTASTRKGAAWVRNTITSNRSPSPQRPASFIYVKPSGSKEAPQPHKSKQSPYCNADASFDSSPLFVYPCKTRNSSLLYFCPDSCAKHIPRPFCEPGKQALDSLLFFFCLSAETGILDGHSTEKGSGG